MRTFLLFTLFFLLTKGAYSQVFWSEDFSNGIPSDWSNEDLSEIGLLWTYCADTTTYGNTQAQPTCPFNFTDCDNRQSHFKSNSPENGFACCVTEPFFNQLGDTAFDTRLTTSAIDCSNQSEVYIIFNTHIGVFDLNALDNAFLQVSTDGVTWTSFVPFPDLEIATTTEIGFRRWSFNPEPVMFDLSEIAANQETVFLQWYWEGNREYHWSIDDIVLTNENPFPRIDISLSPDINFHARMPNFSTPFSQVEPTYFLTDAVQFGLDTLRNVEIIARVTDATNTDTLYEESIFLDELIPNENYFDIIFPPYTHQGGIGNFMVTYSTASEIDDGNPSNNFFEYPFEITEGLLRKHRPTEITKNLFPTTLNQEDFIEQNWGIANYFHIPSGAGMSLDSVVFEIPSRFQIQDFATTYVVNDDDITIDVTLYKWDNSNLDEFASRDEYIEVGVENFNLNGNDGLATIKIKLKNLISGDENIPLEDDQDYFIALDFRPTTTTLFTRLFAVRASIGLNYDATLHVNDLQERLRFAAMAREQSPDLYNTTAFGGNVIPNIWITVAETSTATSTKVLPADVISISPNPANDLTQVTLGFEVEQNASLELLNINGSLIRNIPLENNESQINCLGLASGTYLLRYKSDSSNALQKLVVLH